MPSSENPGTPRTQTADWLGADVFHASTHPAVEMVSLQPSRNRSKDDAGACDGSPVKVIREPIPRSIAAACRYREVSRSTIRDGIRGSICAVRFAREFAADITSLSDVVSSVGVIAARP